MGMKIILVVLTTAILSNHHFAAADTPEAPNSETVKVFDDGTLEVPAQFKRVEPQSQIVQHEFQASDGEGDDAKVARVTMMAAGGNVNQNIARWKGQFSGGDKDAQKTAEMKIGIWEVHIVDASGTYAESMGGGPFAGGKKVNRPDYAMAGAILVHPKGPKFFVKMIGPESVVKANRDAFIKMIKSIE